MSRIRDVRPVSVKEELKKLLVELMETKVTIKNLVDNL